MLNYPDNDNDAALCVFISFFYKAAAFMRMSFMAMLVMMHSEPFSPSLLSSLAAFSFRPFQIHAYKTNTHTHTYTHTLPHVRRLNCLWKFFAQFRISVED